jgi:hypothetical protein
MQMVSAFKMPDILPLYVPARRFGFEGHIKTLNRKVMTIHRLLIAIELSLPN